MFPGHSGAPGGVIHPSRQFERNDSGLTNVELWLHFLKLSLEFGWIVD
jgi:hypothetical protein